MPQPGMPGVIRFGVFELEPQTGILRKHGVRVRLQEQPFQVLMALVEKRGEPVTREELRDKIWAHTNYGDLNHSLNITVNKIREALGDSAETPRYVETLPRRGYRFIAPVEGLTPTPTAPAPTAPEKRRMSKWTLPAVAAFAAVAVVTASVSLLYQPATPQLVWRRLTNDSSAKLGPVLSDGVRLFFRTPTGSGLRILQVPVSGGEPTALPVVPPPGPFYGLLDTTPNGQELLVASYDNVQSNAGPLWALRIVDGAKRRVGNFSAVLARYSPDGKRMLFTAGGVQKQASLWLASSDGSDARRLVEFKDRWIANPCWSPDGKRIEFGLWNFTSENLSAWEVMVDGTGSRRLFPDWADSQMPAGWTSDGRLLLVSQGQFWTVKQPRLFDRWRSRRVQLSAGEPVFTGFLRSRDNRTLYDVGTTPLGQLQRFESHSRTWEPFLGGISAITVEYSRDRQSVVYTTWPDGELWVRRADGSRPVQLTKAPMEASIGRWSPDGRAIAFIGKSESDQPKRVYLVDATGGSAHPVGSADCSAEDLAWMPDGKRIVYDAPFRQYATAEYHLRLLDVTTGQVAKFQDSEGLHSPRISPDGSTLAALFLSPLGNKLALYRFSEGVWKRPPHSGVADWPSWSHDSQSIWYYDLVGSAIVQFHIRENRFEDVLPLKIEEMKGLEGFWFGLAPSDDPMILRFRDVQQIYALDWKHP
jgi:DNA-binding winged helix-turn-helix (wHTH) protein/Tol biopolymer transport system component